MSEHFPDPISDLGHIQDHELQTLSHPELIVMDLDGVCTARESNQVYLDCLTYALDSTGVELNEAEKHQTIEQHWGLRHESILAALLSSHSDKLEAANKVFLDHLYYLYPRRARAIKGVGELLERLSENHILALNTAAEPHLIGQIMKPIFGIDQKKVFQGGIITAYDFWDPGQAKPNSGYTINELMARNGVGPDQTVMVGDSESDVTCAMFSGVPVIVPLTGNLSREEVSAYAEDTGYPVVAVNNVLELDGVFSAAKSELISRGVQSQKELRKLGGTAIFSAI
jgi:phosphoglycolate phosphatase-like HAD superfamily hydrolase